ncbi:D-glycero-beta-D-manno-heptose 1-phosphate adenylyltransferase [Gloeobacter kilaueensis]|uniref:D-glycero-beta-D-manno-heptose 1-phosphate adenylyltransferase n=1 Tax=Gloeobacter kilaueensis (strain ATCC BAA-2537 / CCAP 1431/1 / ULC 316 / JS1) TaxID=1183438 RepID=U5QDK4_GLOK1|nr:D-glycero-beta-D-manno-heptose 1-phosphate adenylyltransferase [Gloeobacter kilaueensis]AGY57017.1 bifunctional protein RfaE [Gloeobacter kilaueensis JS1]
MAERVVSVQVLQQQVAAAPERWRPLVLTNGCFDILHAGHVHYLEQARALGRTLVVGLNSDQSVRQLKGPTRPVVPEGERATVLAALRAVDAVVVFAEATATALVEALQPDIYVKGGDYATRDLPEAQAVAAGGGKIVLIPFRWQTSTSALLARIQKL